MAGVSLNFSLKKCFILFETIMRSNKIDKYGYFSFLKVLATCPKYLIFIPLAWKSSPMLILSHGKITSPFTSSVIKFGIA